jgi:hypothetical protein
MTDKEAMKLALFALDIVKIHYTQSRHINEAIAALKERLAQPEQERDEILQAITDPENQPSQFGTVTLEYHEEKIKQWEDLFDRMRANFERASDKVIAQRTEQEPQDWKTPPKEDAPLVKWAKEQTTPPQRTWVGLTDEEISEAYVIASRKALYGMGATREDVYEAIEAKLSEKNT